MWDGVRRDEDDIDHQKEPQHETRQCHLPPSQSLCSLQSSLGGEDVGMGLFHVLRIRQPQRLPAVSAAEGPMDILVSHPKGRTVSSPDKGRSGLPTGPEIEK